MVDNDLHIEKIQQLSVKIKLLALKPQIGWLFLCLALLCAESSPSREVRRVWEGELSREGVTEPEEPEDMKAVVPEVPVWKEVLASSP